MKIELTNLYKEKNTVMRPMTMPLTVAALFAIMAIISGCGGGGGESKSIFPPETIDSIKLDDTHYWALTKDTLYKTEDVGKTWQSVYKASQVNQNYPASFAAVDWDESILYLASDYGLEYSKDNGVTFEWSLKWTWDGVSDVDFQNGYGWVAISAWGRLSGPLRKEPGGDWGFCRGDMSWGGG